MIRQAPAPHLVAWLTGNTLTVQFTGDEVSLNEEALRPLAEEFAMLTPGRGQRKVLLDFGNVRFVSSPLLDVLLRLHRRLWAAGVRLSVCNTPPDVYEVFETTGLTVLLDVRRGGPPVD
jgi:anti-sigma B factor antagonist